MTTSAPLPLLTPNSQSDAWSSTIERILPSIVVLRVNCVRAWGGDAATSSYATGFIVDAKRGLILTNRHVVTDGPVIADAIMLNKEEVDLVPLYRDPVHDFGFYRFNPADIRFQEVRDITLAPNEAKVGTDIRVVGNDAGEKISILSGTLARIDRNAPSYGSQTYNDFNTFYYAAASNTSGGSSGSPIINIDGRCIALNAGGAYEAASSFYLPLDRAVRALDGLQRYLDGGMGGEGISPTGMLPRGTLRLVLQHLSFGELRRLGLDEDTEREARNQLPLQPFFRRHAAEVDAAKDSPYNTGMLVVMQVIKGGVSEEVIQPGDVLLQINGEWCSHFLSLEEALDDSVGHTIDMVFERGGERREVTLAVEDLHALACPSQFLQCSGAILHRITYQAAKNNNLAPVGVYVAAPGFMLGNSNVHDHTIITQIDDVRIESLDDVASVLSGHYNNDKTVLRYQRLGSHHETVAAIRVCHQWAPMRLHERNDSTGLWEMTKSYSYPQGRRPVNELVPPPAVVVPEESKASPSLSPSSSPSPSPAPTPASSSSPSPSPSPSKKKKGKKKAVEFPSEALVLVKFEVPYSINGLGGTRYIGTGVVVDTVRGLVVTDRNTVPVDLGDVTLNFFNTVEVEGTMLYVHPEHNFVILGYSPARLQSLCSSSAEYGRVKALDFSDQPLRMGDTTMFYGRTVTQDEVVSLSCRVKVIRAFSYSALPSAPRFLAINEDIIRVDQQLNDSCGGVFVDNDGRVQGMLMSYAYTSADGRAAEKMEGSHVGAIAAVVNELRCGRTPKFRGLRVRWTSVKLSTARAAMRMPMEWVDKVQSMWAANPTVRRQLLTVRHSLLTSPAADLLKEGDVLLQLDDTFPTDFWSVEQATYNVDECRLTILRDGCVINVTVPTQELPDHGTDHIVLWCGVLLQQAHLAVLQRGYQPPNGGVYCSFFKYGSPAQKYKVYPRMWIVEVNGTPVPNLDAFVAAIRESTDGMKMRLKTVNLLGQTQMLSLKTDYHYWPTLELRSEQDGDGGREWRIVE